MLQARYRKYRFIFKTPGGTSRGVLHTKDSWHFFLNDTDDPDVTGIGECSILPGLSPDDVPGLEKRIKEAIDELNKGKALPTSLRKDFPAIYFGCEMALRDLQQGGKRILYPSGFVNGETGIPINGLVWMGSFEVMKRQLVEKIESGFRCVKLKIGAIDFREEIRLLRMIRDEFSPRDLEIRVDANGAFSPEEAPEKLGRLSAFSIHSIEQPIRQGQWEAMSALCRAAELPIALDEELIGIHDSRKREEMLQTIKPQYIILKPSLVGGFAASRDYISIAEKHGIGWWVTSALEGNIGLNAIAQWTATLNVTMPQGLGTGQVFKNNIPSPLHIVKDRLYLDSPGRWDLKSLYND